MDLAAISFDSLALALKKNPQTICFVWGGLIEGKPDFAAANVQPLMHSNRRIYDLEVQLSIDAANGNTIVWLWWHSTSRSLLERRWMVERCLGELRKNLKCYEEVHFLDKGASAADLVCIDDVILSRHSETTTQRKDVRTRVYAANELTEASWLKSEAASRTLRLAGALGIREWVNADPGLLTSIEIAKRVERFCHINNCEVKILDQEQLRAEEMNLLLAVGNASDISPPRLIIASYRPLGVHQGDRPLALVGKGITFDSGGLNVKPYESFVHCMKNDMAGAALMAHLFMTLVQLKHPRPLLLAIPACENLVDTRSFKPGSVLHSRRGHKVFIEHTDCEGRLILADALSYVEDNYAPIEFFVAATLTTAAMRQFSNFFTPVHFANEMFLKTLLDAGERRGEKFVGWPEFLPFAEANLSPAADITNLAQLPKATAGSAGSQVAAHFLRPFVRTPLTHLDIFATAWNWSDDYPGAGYGATSAPFMSLLDAFCTYDSPQFQ
jgi:leucyl aminopeptidase